MTDTLVAALKRGDAVTLGDLRAHRVAGVSEAVEVVDDLLCFSTCSLEFTPIKQAFAKLKALLHTAATHTLPHLWAAI